MKMCDIIIPVWDELESTRKCLEHLKDNTLYPYRLIIVDNASSSPTKEFLDKAKDTFSNSILIRNSVNLGFVKAINQGIVTSSAQYICILNNDAYVQKDWLTYLAETIEKGPDNIGMFNPTSNVFGKSSPDGKGGEYQELDSCKGFCMLIKKDVIERVGLFDEIYGIGYFEEKDYSRRAIDAGFICVRSKASYVFHMDRLSFDRLAERDKLFKRNEAIYNKRWGRQLSLAFVLSKGIEPQDENLVYELLKMGHRVNVFFRNINQPELKDHIQIKYFPLKKAFFCYSALYKLWERRNKKKIELVILKDNDILNFFNRYKFIHRADVLNADNNVIKKYCDIKSRGA